MNTSAKILFSAVFIFGFLFFSQSSVLHAVDQEKNPGSAGGIESIKTAAQDVQSSGMEEQKKKAVEMFVHARQPQGRSKEDKKAIRKMKKQWAEQVGKLTAKRS